MKAPVHERKLHLDGTEKPGIQNTRERLPLTGVERTGKRRSGFEWFAQFEL